MSVAVPTRPVPIAERLQRFAARPEAPSLLFLAAVLVAFSLTIDASSM